ncbi:hypothetical protein LEMLEM_LOCUS11376 [Lemmus lemmus]
MSERSQCQSILADGYLDLIRPLCHAVYWREQDKAAVIQIGRGGESGVECHLQRKKTP